MSFMPNSYIELTSTTSYPATAQVAVGFVPDEFWFRNESVNDCEIAVSFDGVNDHIILKAGYTNQYGRRDGMSDDMRIRSRYPRVWARAVTVPAMGGVFLRTMAWTDTVH